jgi:MFS family permease
MVALSPAPPTANYHPLAARMSNEEDADDYDGDYNNLSRPAAARSRRSGRSNGSETETFRVASLSAHDTREYNNGAPIPSSFETFLLTVQQEHERRVAVILLCLCTILVFADQNLMAPNLTAMARDFHFDDMQRDQKLGGDIALAFFVLGAPASLLIGCWADCTNRARLLAATIACGEGACVATYWVETYAQLYTCRALTGISVGGALPLIYSLLGDLFAAKDRHKASSYVGIGVGVGISLGQGVAGFLGPTFGWRLPFLVIGIPALLCAALFACLVTDPERGGMEDVVLMSRLRTDTVLHSANEYVSSAEETNGVDSKPSHHAKPVQRVSSLEMSPLNNHSVSHDADEERANQLNLDPGPASEHRKALGLCWCELLAPCRGLLSTPTVIFALLQGAPGCVPWGIVNTYLTDFLAVNRGLSVESATLTMLLFGVGNFFGMLMGGYGGAHLYRCSPRYPALLAGGMAMAGCFPFWILLNHVNASSSLWLVLGPVSMSAGLCTGVTGPIIKATLQNVTLPQSRGQAFAWFNTFDDFGRGLGPVFVASLIAKLGGRTPAFNVGILGWMVCGAFNLCVFCTVQHDERKIQRLLAQDLQSHSESNDRRAVPSDLLQPTLDAD